MTQLVNGVVDMFQKLIIHRDLKLENIMIHFPNESHNILKMNRQSRDRFMEEVDLT